MLLYLPQAMAGLSLVDVFSSNINIIIVMKYNLLIIYSNNCKSTIKLNDKLMPLNVWQLVVESPYNHQFSSNMGFKSPQVLIQAHQRVLLSLCEHISSHWELLIATFVLESSWDTILATFQQSQYSESLFYTIVIISSFYRIVLYKNILKYSRIILLQF